MKKYIYGILLAVIALLALIFVGFAISSIDTTSKVAVIPVEGVLISRSSLPFNADVASSRELQKFIKEANEDDSVVAIVLEINSPGGTPVASKEVADAILGSEKPTYAVIREIGTSGAYWVASAADVVIADDISIVGSIGVLASYIEFSGFLKDYNVTYERLVGGKYKDIGSPLKPLTPNERDILQEKIDVLHQYFIQAVADNRGMSYNEVELLATGEFFLGMEAQELGLVDGLGNMETVKDVLKNDFGPIEYRYYRSKRGLFDVFGGVSSAHGYALGQALRADTQYEAPLRT